MTKYREIIRLTGLGFSQREIMAGCGVEQKTVVKVQKRARELNLSWPLDEAMTDTEFQKLSMWARMKSELLYDRYDADKMTTDELRTIIWRYFISYWNNRRICSANGGLPPVLKRQQYYDSLKAAA